jgi:hypothetical protein
LDLSEDLRAAPPVTRAFKAPSPAHRGPGPGNLRVKLVQLLWHGCCSPTVRFGLKGAGWTRR